MINRRISSIALVTATLLTGAVRVSASPEPSSNSTPEATGHSTPMSWMMSADFPDVCRWPDLCELLGVDDSTDATITGRDPADARRCENLVAVPCP